MAEKYDKEIKEIMSILGEDAEKKEIEKEMKSYIEEFRLSPGEAKKLVLRKHGVGMAAGPDAVQKTIKELTPMDKNVNVLGRVLFAADKTIKADGKEKAIISGILGDDSGTVPFTHWEKGALSLAKGDVIRLEHAYVTEYKDEPQLNIGNRGRIVKLDKSDMPEFKGTGTGFKPAKACKVMDLGEATGNISLVARILEMDTREVTVSGEKKDVLSGIMADETGKVSFTCWGKAKIKEGDAVRVNTGYLRKWRGMPQFNFDAANVEKSDEKMPKSGDLQKPSVVTIEYLSRVGGMVDAAIHGVILDVREGSGLVFRCPECNRVLQKGECRVHGKADGSPDLRIKAIIDDGTGAISAIIGRDITEKLLGKSLEKCMKEAQKAMSHEIIRDQLFDKLVAMPVSVSGNVTSDDFGLMLIATSTEFRIEDPQDKARKMLEEVTA
jgi:replication factor A1